MKPDPNSKFGNAPENWTVENRADHAFDCLKMGYWVRDWCIKELNKDKFNYAQSPRLRRKFEGQSPQAVLQTAKE